MAISYPLKGDKKRKKIIAINFGRNKKAIIFAILFSTKWVEKKEIEGKSIFIRIQRSLTIMGK
jgi:hypothetical protein